MTGLREKQKADRERRILKAAVSKFRADGYRAARIEDLAEMAEVSVGTITITSLAMFNVIACFAGSASLPVFQQSFFT